MTRWALAGAALLLVIVYARPMGQLLLALTAALGGAWDGLGK